MDTAWVSGWFTVGAAVLGFGPVAYQIWWQGRQNRKAEDAARKQQFNEELYRDGVAAARRLANTSSSFNTALYILTNQLELAILIAQKHDEAVRPPDKRYPEFLELNRQFSDTLIDLVFLIEERLIADQRLEIFRLALLSKAHDVQSRFDGELQWAMLGAMQHQLPDGTLSAYTVPTDEQFARLKAMFAELQDPLHDCTAFANDLIVELQNTLLGDAFGTRLNHRVALDPDKKVLRLEDFDELMEWVDSTPWGERNRQVEEQTKSELEQRKLEQDGI